MRKNVRLNDDVARLLHSYVRALRASYPDDLVDSNHVCNVFLQEAISRNLIAVSEAQNG